MKDRGNINISTRDNLKTWRRLADKPAKQDIQQEKRPTEWDYYRDIVERQTELVIRFLPDGTITFANQAFHDLFGSLMTDTSVEPNFIKAIAPTVQAGMIEQIASIAEVKHFQDIEHWLELPNDARHWIKWNFQAIMYGNELIEIQAVGRDTTSRVRAEEELRESEEKIKALINTPTDTAILMTTEWKVLAINQIGAKRFGQSVNALVGQYLHRYLPPKVYEFRKPKFDRVRRSGKPAFFEDKRDGRVLESHVYPLFDHCGKVDRFAVFTRDITEKKKALELLKKREAELEKETGRLEEANIALKVLLKRRDDDKTELEEKVWFNMKELVIPYLEKLMNSGLNQRQNFLAKRLEYSLEEIISPLARKMSVEYCGFTSSEVQVANLIKQGLSTKDMANYFNLSERTIEFHRENIRKKLGLKQKKVNLKSYLLSQ